MVSTTATVAASYSTPITARHASSTSASTAGLPKHCRGFFYGGAWEDIEQHADEAWYDLTPEQREELTAVLAATDSMDMLDWLKEMDE